MAKTKEIADKLLSNISMAIPDDGLHEKLATAEKEGRKLIIKLGVDPTAPDLHLGHAVVLKKLREFCDLEHEIILIIGDFTARIGDPTGRNITRPNLSEEEIDKNIKTYIDQLSKIIDPKAIKIRKNSEWLEPLNLADVINVTSKITISQILQRNDFSERYKNGKPISLHEFLYPVLQAYDSLEISADVEIGGTDQMFNCLMGRQLQEAVGEEGQVVICMPILPGLDGVEKMSKSKNNYIGLTEEPENIYGKAMSIPDDIMEEFFSLVSSFSSKEISSFMQDMKKGKNPIEIKKQLAYDIVENLAGEKAAKAAAEHFYNQVQSSSIEKKEKQQINMNEVIKELDTKELKLIDLCHYLQKEKSKSHIRRLIADGGISIDNEKVFDSNQVLSEKKFILKIGKRNFYEVV